MFGVSPSKITKMFATRLRIPLNPTYSVRLASDKPSKVYYAVGIGKEVGIYESWKDCELQIKGYPNARYQKFNTAEEAQQFVQYWKNFSKISNIELESLKSKNSKDMSNKDYVKNVMSLASEMALLKSDFKKIKEAIISNSKSWYRKKQIQKTESNMENKTESGQTQNNSLGFISLNKAKLSVKESAGPSVKTSDKKSVKSSDKPSMESSLKPLAESCLKSSQQPSELFSSSFLKNKVTFPWKDTFNNFFRKCN